MLQVYEEESFDSDEHVAIATIFAQVEILQADLTNNNHHAKLSEDFSTGISICMYKMFMVCHRKTWRLISIVTFTTQLLAVTLTCGFSEIPLSLSVFQLSFNAACFVTIQSALW